MIIKQPQLDSWTQLLKSFIRHPSQTFLWYQK